MNEDNKTYLRNRWKDVDFLNSLPIQNQSIPVAQLNGLDLRGVPKLGCGEPLWKFLTIYSSQIHHLRLSFGNGALNISNTRMTNLECIEFKFDQSSSFSNSTFSDSTFEKSRLKMNVTDVKFYNCDFSQSVLKGGFREYGFRRCKFIHCKFNSAQWQNTYLFACQFSDCDFTGFGISHSLIRGFKMNRPTEFVTGIFEDCEIEGLIEINL